MKTGLLALSLLTITSTVHAQDPDCDATYKARHMAFLDADLAATDANIAALKAFIAAGGSGDYLAAPLVFDQPMAIKLENLQCAAHDRATYGYSLAITRVVKNRESGLTTMAEVEQLLAKTREVASCSRWDGAKVAEPKACVKAGAK